jgi:septal ring factor EnvC (AmiA/AmiB activator)
VKVEEVKQVSKKLENATKELNETKTEDKSLKKELNADKAKLDTLEYKVKDS